MTTTNLGMTVPTVGADTDNWGNDLNADLGLIDGFAGKLMPGAEVSLASATTTDIGDAVSTGVAISGTTTITSFGAVANCIRFVRFSGALTLTHNATSLILLGGASRTTAAGDCGIYQSDASGNWRQKGYCSAGYNPGAHTGTGAYVHATAAAAAGTFNGFNRIFSGFITSSGTDTGINVNTGGAAGVMNLVYVNGQDNTGNFTYSAIYMVRFGDSGDNVGVTRIAFDSGSTSLSDFGFSVSGSHTLVVTAPTLMNNVVVIHQLVG